MESNVEGYEITCDMHRMRNQERKLARSRVKFCFAMFFRPQVTKGFIRGFKLPIVPQL